MAQGLINGALQEGVKGGRLYMTADDLASVAYYKAGSDKTDLSTYTEITGSEYCLYYYPGRNEAYFGATTPGLMLEIELKESVIPVSFESWLASNVGSPYQLTLRILGLNGSVWDELVNDTYTGSGYEGTPLRRYRKVETSTKYSKYRFVFYHSDGSAGRYMRMYTQSILEWK